MWMGTPVRIVGVTGKALARMAGVSLSQHIICFESGKSAIFESMLAPRGISDQPFFSLQGTLGEITIDGFSGGCTLHTLDPATDAPVAVELCNEGWDAGYAGEYVDFVEAVCDGKATKGPLSEALADLEVVCGMLSSAEADRWIDL
mmetsp:Transcript_16959/g.44152  ORF Transcript_16959/g.44152 Transcript_16959/m.44152 type:complete len:146 (-) Transcript_16959:180-617(-)